MSQTINYEGKIFILNNDAEANTISRSLPSGHNLSGTFWEAFANDEDGELYHVLWNYKEEDEEGNCVDWDTPNYVIHC